MLASQQLSVAVEPVGEEGIDCPAAPTLVSLITFQPLFFIQMSHFAGHVEEKWWDWVSIEFNSRYCGLIGEASNRGYLIARNDHATPPTTRKLTVN